MFSQRIVPSTKDYVIDSVGRIDHDDGSQTSVYLALATQLGSVPAAPLFGSKLFLLQREAFTTVAPRNAERFTVEALAALVRAGRISDVSVRADREESSGFLGVLLTYKDQSGKPQRYPFRVPVGS